MGRNRWGIACGLAAVTLGMTAPAQAAAPHVVQPGETLWSISAANNFTTRTVAAFNGIAEDAQVVEGSTIQIPTVEEGAAALAAAGIVPGSPPATTAAPNPPPHRGTSGRYTGGDVRPGLRPIARTASFRSTPPPRPRGTRCARSPSPPSASTSTRRARCRPTAPASSRPTCTTCTCRARARRRTRRGAPRTRWASPSTSRREEMRSVIDQIGPAYGWHAPHSNEWWHVEYWG